MIALKASTQCHRYRCPPFAATSIPVAAIVTVAFGLGVAMSLPLAADALEIEVPAQKVAQGLPYSADNLVKDDASFLDKKKECESCIASLECESNICSSQFQCAGSDGLGGAGCRCLKDDNCRSGFCDWGFKCRAKKLDIGETGCTESDDCQPGLFCAPKIGSGSVTECKAKLDENSVCAKDNQCRSGDCTFKDASCPRCCVGTNAPTSSPTPSTNTTDDSSGGYQYKRAAGGWKGLGWQVVFLVGMHLCVDYIQ